MHFFTVLPGGYLGGAFSFGAVLIFGAGFLGGSFGSDGALFQIVLRTGGFFLGTGGTGGAFVGFATLAVKLAGVQLLLEDDETLVIHWLSGGSFALDSIARREAGTATTARLRGFLACKLRVMPYQVYLLDGLRLLSDCDPILRSTLSVTIVPGDPEEHEGVLPRRLRL